MASMKKSTIYPKYENGNSCSYEFDPQADFIQFLEEARKHVTEGEFKTALQNAEDQGDKHLNVEKRHRKSWKNTLFSWLKTGKKNKPEVEPLKAPTISKPRQGYVSGPIQRGGNGSSTGKARKPASGPLTSLFNSTKRVENETSYMCLQRLNNPPDLQSYGPVYLVT